MRKRKDSTLLPPRLRSATVAVAASTLALSGCLFNPAAPSVEDTVPPAVIAANVAGVEDVLAETSVSGSSAQIWVGLVVDPEQFGADELRAVIDATMPAVNDSSTRNPDYLEVSARVGDWNGDFVDLAPAYEELGFVQGDSPFADEAFFFTIADVERLLGAVDSSGGTP